MKDNIAVASSSKSSLSDWVVSVQNMELMPDPHCEQGSQDSFVIDAAHSLVPLQDITAMRSVEGWVISAHALRLLP